LKKKNRLAKYSIVQKKKSAQDFYALLCVCLDAAIFVRECVFVKLSVFTFDTFAVMRAAISNGNMECHRNSREIRDSPRSGRARVGRRRRPVAARRRRRTRVRVSERVYCNVREKITGFEVDGELGFAGFGGTRRR
jgi:hypothetical protein